MTMRWAASLFLPLGLLAAVAPAATAADPSAIEQGLAITAPDGTTRSVDLEGALKLLKVPSASIALIDRGEIAFARAFGESATPDTLYQAASLSKFVAAIGAMRLVEEGTLELDQDVNEALTSWRIPPSDFDRERKVNSRGLLSMTAGIGVPGFLGYEPGAPLPALTEILNGTPPANSAPITLVKQPGTYAYSGGGYEIAEALMQDVTGKQFPELMQALVLGPAGMTASSFEQPVPAHFATKAASGHFSDGSELPGRWQIFPEHAAASLWSTPTDIAKLLVALVKGWHGASTLLSSDTLGQMLTQQNGGPYGLGAAITGDGSSLVLMKRGQMSAIRAISFSTPRPAREWSCSPIPTTARSWPRP